MPQLALFAHRRPVLAGRRRDRAGAAASRRAADPRLPPRLVRVPHRLQPRFPTRRGRCSSGVRTLIIDALRDRPHPTHFSVGEALDVGRARSAPSAPTSRTSATICRTPPPARACPPAWSWPMMASCRRRAMRALRAVRRCPDGRHPFSRRSRGRRAGCSRCSRSATSTACTAATGRSSIACAASPASAAPRSVVMTFDPHPPRVVRPDKAPPLLMTKAQKLEALAAGRRAGRRDRALHARAVALGSGDVRPDRARRLAARRPRSGSARTSCSATIAPAISRCCATLGARYGFKAEKIDPVRYKDFVVSSTRVRRLVSEGRVDEAGALLGHQYFIDGTVVRGDQRGRDDRVSDREPLHRQRAAAAARRLRDDGDDRRRSCMPSVTNIGVASDGRCSPAASTIETHIFDLDRDLYGAADPRRLRAAAARRAGVRSRWTRSGADRCRLRARARAVRPSFTVESLVVSDQRLSSSRSTLSGDAGVRPRCSASSRARVLGARRLRRARRVAALTRRAATRRWPSACADGRAALRRPVPRRRRHSSRSSSPAPAARELARPTAAAADVLIRSMRLYNTLTRREEDVRAAARTTPSACTPAA